MTNPNEVNALFFGGESSNLFYQISRSLRFDRATSAYLNRTPSVAGNLQKWTFSTWIKRANPFAVQEWIFQATGSGGTQNDGIFFDTNDRLCVNFNNAAVLVSTAKFRDPGAWMNIIVAVDTTQFTPADRFKVYINGQAYTTWTTATYPVQNTNGLINGAFQHFIGRNTGGNYFGGYMTEVRFIDGSQSDPSDFGTTSPFTNEWQPIPYIGSYGTNGFYINFSDNSNTTATTLGKDYSGNGNNWTPNAFSVTTGINNDSMIDVPTRWDDGGNGRGNYPVFNNVILNNQTGMLADGNLQATMDSGTYNENYAISTINIPTTGKWYFEVYVATLSGTDTMFIGVARQNVLYSNVSTSANFRMYQQNGNKVAATATTYGATYTANDLIGVAVDNDNGEITFYKNGVSQGVAFNDLNTAGGNWAPMVHGTSSNITSAIANFGQRAFAYTPPTGFKAINTYSMPLPTILSGQDYCEPLPYTGSAPSTKQVTGLQFQPDLVWVKSLGITEFGRVVDSLRGATLAVQAGNNVAQQTETTGLTAFTSDGFTLGTSSGYNASGQNYISWNFAASQTTVTNTSGTITSSTRSNPTAGFSIVKYTGTGANATVGHGAGGVPVFILIKDLTGTNLGVAYHSSLGAGSYLQWSPVTGTASVSSATVFNNTAPTSTQFSLGTSVLTNANGNEYIAYVWSAVPGYCAAGSYASASDLPFQYCGFLPALLVSKSISSFLAKDDQRSSYGNSADLNGGWATSGPDNTTVGANSTADAYGHPVDLISNGFKLRGFNSPGTSNLYNSNNISGGTVYWVAWGRSPIKFTNAR